MAISITTTDPKTASQDARKTRNVYDNLDNLKAVIHYDASNNVDYVLEASNNSSGKSLENKKLQQIQIDVVEAASDITANSAILKARIVKNDNSKVSETGFVYWTGSNEASVIGKTESGTVVSPAAVLKGSFTKTVTNLADNTVYYYRAYIKHEYGTNYSRVYQFTTVAGNTVFAIAGNKFSGPAPLTVSLSAINAGGGVSSYAWNLTGGFNPDFTTQVVDYTYLSAGTFTARASAIMTNGTVKTATRQINATGSTNYSAEWSNVLASSYGSNIIGAYDFRNLGNVGLGKDLVAFWKFNGSSADASFGNPSYFLTNEGNITYSTGKVGGCINLPPESRVRIDENLWDMVASPTSFSVAFWVKKNAITTSPQGSILAGNIFGPMGFHIGYGTVINGSHTNYENGIFFGVTTESSNYKYINAQFSVNLGEWNYIVCTYDPDSTTAKIYLNGNLVDTRNDIAPPTSTQHPSWNGFAINGSTIGTSSSEYGGDHSYDGFGLWSRALLQSEVAALYNAGNGTEDVGVVKAIVGPNMSIVGNTQIEAINGDGSYDKVSLLLEMEGTTGSTNFIDQSTNSLSVTAFGNTQIVSISGVGLPAAYFDSNGSYLRGNATVNYSNNFTIEGWFCRKAIGNGQVNTLFEAGNIGGGQGGVHLYIEPNTEGTFVLNNGFTYAGSATVGAPLNQWVHFAIVRNSGTNTLYINGIAVHTDNQTYPVNNTIFSIGGAPNYGFYVNGYVDDFRITEGVARYTSNFIPPSGPLPTTSDPNFANVKLLLNMSNLTEEEILDVSKNDFSLQPYGNVTSSTAETNFRSSSIYFDGNGDYLVLEDSGGFTLNGVPFCIEAWIYPTQVDSTLRAVVGKDTYGSNFSWCLGFTNSKLLCYTSNINGNWQFEANASVQTNTWQHVAVTFDGTNQRLFLDGQLLGTKAAPITNQPSKISVGCLSWNNPGSFYQGYIDDLRITKGVARYTGNFTPPAAEFPTTGDTDYNKVSLLLRSNPPVPFVDSSSSNLTITKNGQAKMTLRAPSFSRGNYASFDGSGDYLQTTISDWSPGVGGEPFTVEFWVYRKSSNIQMFVSKNGGADAWNSTDGFDISFYADSSNLYFEFWNGGSAVGITNNVSIPVGKWTHLAAVYNGSLTTIFVNGIVQPNTSNSSYGVVSQANIFEIGGKIGYGGNAPLNGYIDDLRITKGVARYVNNFIPPQTLPTDVGDLVGLKFIPGPSYGETTETVATTFPHTLVLVAKADSLSTPDVNYITALANKWSPALDQYYLIFSRPEQGLMANNGLDNQTIGYTPDGTEWFYIAMSFLSNNTCRYYIKSATIDQHGTVSSATTQNFNGFFAVGRKDNRAAETNIFGSVRTGMFINQAFSTQSDMENLYNDIISGPVTDLGF